MELTKTSWHYRLYEAVYDSEPNSNFCNYFWKLVYAIVTLPFTFLFLLYNRIGKHKIKGGIALLGLVYIACIALGAMLPGKLAYVGEVSSNYILKGAIVYYLVLMYLLIFGGLMIAGVYALAIIVLGGEQVFKAFKSKRNPTKPKKINLLRAWFRSVKEKNCPVITWKDE